MFVHGEAIVCVIREAAQGERQLGHCEKITSFDCLFVYYAGTYNGNQHLRVCYKEALLSVATYSVRL